MLTPRDVMNETVAFLGEFIGTFLFLFFAYAGTQTVNHAQSLKDPLLSEETKKLPNLDNLLFISTIFGISLMVNVWIFFRISGGMFNPAVTMALYLVGAFPILRAIVVVAAQIVGGITAAGVVKYLIPSGKSVNFAVSLGDGTSIARGLFLEMFFTAELIFTILMLAAEKSKTTFIAPVGIGFALFIGHICGVFYTGAGLNPARSFGPAVVAGDFPSYHWIYWFGPVMGGLVAVVFFKLLKLLRYEDTNGDQDKAAYEPESFETFMDRKVKEASNLIGGTTKRASALLERTTGTATALLHESRMGGLKRKREPAFTGDGSSFGRRPSTAGSAKPTSLRSPRYESEYYDRPRQQQYIQYYTPPPPPPRPRPPIPPSSSGRSIIGNSPEFHKKYPISTIYSASARSSVKSPSSSILYPAPSKPPSPSVPAYDNRYEIPVGVTPRAGGYMQENPQMDMDVYMYKEMSRDRNLEGFRFPGGFSKSESVDPAMIGNAVAGRGGDGGGGGWGVGSAMQVPPMRYETVPPI